MLERLMSRLQRHASAMGRMMRLAGVDAEAAARLRGGAALAEAARRCRACGEGEACAAWLTQSESGGGDHAQPGVAPFCPNAAFMEAARVRQASWPESPWPAQPSAPAENLAPSRKGG